MRKRSSPSRTNVRSSPKSRQNILRAARRLFLQRGYEATTMNDVVKAARTSIGNAYFYFENKEDLAATLIEELAAEAWVSTDAVMTSVPPGPTRLAVMVMANATMLTGTHADLLRLTVIGESTTAIRQRVSRLFAERIRATIAENVPAYPAERLDLAVAAWLGAARNCYEQYALGEITGSPLDIAAHVLTWNLRGLGLDDATIDGAIADARRVVMASKGAGTHRKPTGVS